MIALHQLSFGGRLANIGVSYLAYVGQMFWPLHLAVVYPYPPGGRSSIEVMVAFALLAIVSVIFFRYRAEYPFLIVGWLWYLGMLVPMIGIVQVGMQARADRYTYLSQIGLCLALVWWVTAWVRRRSHTRQLLAVLTSLILVGLTVISYGQTSSWRDSETLWNHALANTSNNYIAQTHLGEVVLNKGRVDEAIGYLREAVRLSDYPTAHYSLGYALASKGEWAGAVVSFRAAIRTRPNYPQAHSNLAVSLSALGKTEEAIEEFREALRLDENYRDAHRNLGILLRRLNRRDEAIVHLKEALRLMPDDPQVKAQLQELGVGN